MQSQQTQTSNQTIQLNNITDLLLYASCSVHVACIDSSLKRKIHTRNNHQKKSLTVQALNPPNYSMVSMLTILEKFPLRFITWIKTRKNIVLKKRSWGGMVFLKMKIGCWVETEGFILCFVCMLLYIFQKCI